MSAICGLVRRDGGPVSSEPIQTMLGTLVHRGPDGRSAWSKDSVGLGHCMLHVTPESLTECLPYVTANDNYAITAEARIDNRTELIATLNLRGPHREITDSFLILKAYEKWGEECAIHLIGDFAFAIWDNRRQILFCAVDSVGVRSFYYYLSDRIFAFASEIKALLALSEVPCRLSETRVADYLVMLFEDRSGTSYEGILRLPGGSTLTVDAKSCKVRKYWALNAKRELRLSSDGEYAEAFREVFTEAVRCRTRSAFPIGTALSGGLDSSSIACVTRREILGPVHTYSLIFPGLPAEDRQVIDERPQIQAVLDSGGFEPHFIEADRISPMHEADRMHFHLEQANCAPNLYLHWAMYKAAQSNGVRVFLDGFDGDATVSHGFERLTELAQTIQWRSLWRESRLLAGNHLAGMRPQTIIKQFCLKSMLPSWSQATWHFLKGHRREAGAPSSLISQGLKDRTGIEKRARSMLRAQSSWALTRGARKSHLESVTQAIYAYTLEIADKASAAFSMEARYPFFDRRMMEFCLSLPARQKLGQGWNRWVFRRAMAGILPPEIQWRPNKGNLSPNFNRRLLDFERERLEDVIFGERRELRPYVDSKVMAATYREYQKSHVRGTGESMQLFAAVNLALWLRSSGFSS